MKRSKTGTSSSKLLFTLNYLALSWRPRVMCATSNQIWLHSPRSQQSYHGEVVKFFAYLAESKTYTLFYRYRKHSALGLKRMHVTMHLSKSLREKPSSLDQINPVSGCKTFGLAFQETVIDLAKNQGS